MIARNMTGPWPSGAQADCAALGKLAKNAIAS